MKCVDIGGWTEYRSVMYFPSEEREALQVYGNGLVEGYTTMKVYLGNEILLPADLLICFVTAGEKRKGKEGGMPVDWIVKKVNIEVAGGCVEERAYVVNEGSQNQVDLSYVESVQFGCHSEVSHCGVLVSGCRPRSHPTSS